MLIDYDSCRRFAQVLKSADIVSTCVEDFADGVFYPSRGEDPESVARFFFFTVAIDHRTRIRGFKYEAVVNGRKAFGASLLYLLSMRKFREDPDLFSPERMSKISVKELKEWLEIGEARIWDPEIRAFLLRDAGYKLLKLYEGCVLNVIKTSEYKLYNPPEGGFVERLKVFRAYEDPVEKKPFLLVKFLERRGIFEPRDCENLQVPVDNHLVRIAVRTGVVKLHPEEEELFKWKREATMEEDVIVRLTIRRAYKCISDALNAKPTLLDDFLWNHGRTVCTPENPKCGKCILRNACKSFLSKRYLLEHKFLNTWYY